MPDADPQRTSCYYINPIAMPPLDRWRDELARISALGFGTIVLAPIFATGRDRSLFLVADDAVLHVGLGGGDALRGMRRICEAARENGLAVMLDLRPGRMDGDAVLVRDHPEWSAEGREVDPLPDPRRSVDAGVRLRAEDRDLRAWWIARATDWVSAGIGGFRCLDLDLGSAFWGPVIGGIRKAHPDTRFIAWAQGSSAATVRDLAGCGFDLIASSLPWWDYRAAWWGEELATLQSVAPILNMPESPFARRHAAEFADSVLAQRAGERALRTAALAGENWLLPMGFEFGALNRMGQNAGEAEAFAALRAAPRIDLQSAIRDVNRERTQRGGVRETALVSRPKAAVAQILVTGADGTQQAVLVNTSLSRSAAVSPSQITESLPAAASIASDGAMPDLAPGEVRAVPLRDMPPVVVEPADTDVAARRSAEAPRIAIEAVTPCVDGGRFPVKRIVGHPVPVTADVFADGATRLSVWLLWRPADETPWREVPMRHAGNDSYVATFLPERVGPHLYTIAAWVDPYAAFVNEITAKHGAGIPVGLERREGIALLEAARAALPAEEASELASLIRRLARADDAEAVARFSLPRSIELVRRANQRPFLVTHEPVLRLDVERRAAGFAAWYEIFPRSQSGDGTRHGTFADVIDQLPRIREMGFDVLYFPPIHPIGRKNRKGRNNSLVAEAGDPGSPYAIGADTGGHDAVHPELGTLADFRTLVSAAAQHGLELALDFAIQCAPDHPWLKEHPGWFAYRPDGSIRYAENPPKKYEDIVNVDFYAKDAVPALWIALRDVVLFWVEQGVRLFRVDNPHTKPLPFWEWMIGDVRARHPDCVFLSEAFTRPKVMYRLAKVGFSQSYTYFTWRNTAWELGQYMRELNEAPVADFFRPHFFVNTPDINPTFLQQSGRPGHLIRATLAATLSGLWGVYNGFELCEAEPVRPGKEEYLDSEKYQLRAWDYDRPGHIKAEIALLNRLRKQNPALQTHLGTTVLDSGHEQVLLYVKATRDLSNVVLVAVSMDPAHAVETWIELPQATMALPDGAALLAEDLLRGGEERWDGPRRHLRLDPAHLPFAIWRLRRVEEA